MARKKNLIGFNWLPASWGLSGKLYEERKAYYEHEGESLERLLIKINEDDETKRKFLNLEVDKKYNKIDSYDYDLEKLKLENQIDGNYTASQKDVLGISLKHNKISQYDYDLEIANIDFTNKDGADYKCAILKANYDAGKIKQLEYDKATATAKGEPWVGISDNGFETEKGINGLYFELDWNQEWVDYLRINGYEGYSEEQIVDQWFSDVCRAQIQNMDDDLDRVMPLNPRGIIQRVDGDGSTEYS